jgi:phosphatidylinositol alpha-1,6-mannosyltransferase
MRDASSSRPLALLITRNFPPLLGGMEKVNQHLLAALQPTWRTALCGPAGAADYAPPQTDVKQGRIRPLPLFLIATFWRALGVAFRYRPELVMAGSGLTAPIAWLVTRCFGGKAVVYLHGLDIVAPSRIYQALWLPFIRRCDMCLANSANTAQLAERYGVPHDRLHILHPGVWLAQLDSTLASDFRERYGFGNQPLLLSVGRLTQRKGLAEFVAKALPIVVSRYASVVLVVIGEEAHDALHTKSGSERDRILESARAAGVERNLRFLGRCDEVTLGAAYQAADLHIFPVLDLPGDVEGFGMVALESAAHGLPTVAFAVGGVPDAVLDGQTGTLIEPRNYTDLGMAVVKRLEFARNESVSEICRAFAAGKAWPVFGERLRALLSKLYG